MTGCHGQRERPWKQSQSWSTQASRLCCCGNRRSQSPAVSKGVSLRIRSLLWGRGGGGGGVGGGPAVLASPAPAVLGGPLSRSAASTRPNGAGWRPKRNGLARRSCCALLDEYCRGCPVEEEDDDDDDNGRNNRGWDLPAVLADNSLRITITWVTIITNRKKTKKTANR